MDFFRSTYAIRRARHTATGLARVAVDLGRRHRRIFLHSSLQDHWLCVAGHAGLGITSGYRLHGVDEKQRAHQPPFAARNGSADRSDSHGRDGCGRTLQSETNQHRRGPDLGL